MGTDAFDKIVGRGHLEVCGKVYCRNGDMLQTIGALTTLAKEMYVQVIVHMCIVAVA